MNQQEDMPLTGKNNQKDALFSDLLPEDVIAKCDHFKEATESNLITILRDNANTEAGSCLGFSDMDSVDKFRSGVTLSNYDDYKAFIECMQLGDDNLITSYKLESFLKSSGTDGDEKILPITETALSRYKNYIDIPCSRIREKAGGKRLMVSLLRVDVNSATPGQSELLLSGAYYRYQYKHGLMNIDTFAGGEPLTFFHRNCDFFYAKVWLAFINDDITTIESIFLYDTLLFFRYMEKNFEQIIENMLAHDIPLSVNLPQRAKQALLSLDIDIERLNLVKTECEKGFDDIVSRLWPGIRVISGIGSDIYNHEEHVLRRYTGDIPLWYFCYVASECHIGISVEPGSKDYLLLPDSAYYEFLPKDHTVEPEKWVKTVSEIQVGEDYEIVLTTFNGLYRYMLGDIIRVVGFRGQAPIIRFLYRRKQMLNIAGEKINEKTLSTAVQSALEFYRHTAYEYFFRVNYSESPACYEAFFSSDKELNAIDISYFSRILDTELKQESYDYSDLRNLNMIGSVKVNWLTPDEYDSIKKQTNGHTKPLHIVNQAKPDYEKNQY